MALLITSYDLSLGETVTTQTITGASYIDFQTLPDTVAGRVKLTFVRKQAAGDYVDIKSAGKVIEYSSLNNEEIADGIQLLGSGIAVAVRITPIGSVTGTLSIDVITDGTIA